jgi:hypothetical protein
MRGGLKFYAQIRKRKLPGQIAGKKFQPTVNGTAAIVTDYTVTEVGVAWSNAPAITGKLGWVGREGIDLTPYARLQMLV